MKSMRSNRRRKKGKVYYSRLQLQRGRKKKETIERILEKTAKFLPKKLQSYVDEAVIKALTNQIWVDKEMSFSGYTALGEYAKSRYRHSMQGTKEELYRRFRTSPETQPVYNKFNSYMFRNGHSARNWWFQNVKFTGESSWIFATCELPKLSIGVHYELLEINFNYSNHEIEAYLY